MKPTDPTHQPSQDQDQQAEPKDSSSSEAEHLVPPATLSLLPANSIADQVAEEVAETRYPVVNQALFEAQTERATHQVTAAASLPIDPNQSQADTLLKKDLQEARDQVATIRTERTEAEKNYAEAAGKEADTTCPAAGWWRRLVEGSTVGISLLCAYGLAELMSPTVDEIFLRKYFAGVFADNAASVSSERAYTLTFWTTAGLLLLEAGAVVLGGGMLSPIAKVGFFAVAFVFALSFALIRMTDSEFTWPPLAFATLEFGVLAAAGFFFLVIAKFLREDQAQRQTFALASAARQIAADRFATQQEKLEEAEKRYATLLRAFSEREAGARRLKAHQELAMASVKVASIVANAKLISEYTTAAFDEPAEKAQPPQAEKIKVVATDAPPATSKGGGK